jgi:hypothetical protein
MFTLTILLTSFAILIASAYLYQLASGEPVWRLNMLTYSFYLLVASSFVASIVIVLDIRFMGYNPENMVRYLYGDERRHLTVWGMVLWMLVGIPLGAVFVNLLLERRPIRAVMRRYRLSAIRVGWGLSEKSLYRLVLFVSVALGLLLLYLQAHTTALSTIIRTGNVYESEVVRRAAKEGTGFRLFDSMFNEGTLQWLSSIAFAMALETRRWKWRLLFAALFALLIYFGLSSGVTGRILYYLVALALMRSLLGRKFIKGWELAAGAGLLFVLFITFKGAEGGILKVLWINVGTRMFITQLFGTYVALDLFPWHHAFIGFGSTGRMIHEVLGGTVVDNYGLLLMRYYRPADVEAGFASHVTTIFMGEAWANFGLVGVIVAPLWVGIVVQLVNRAFIHQRKSIIALALYSYLATTFGYVSDFMGFYYPLGTILFVSGTFAIVMVARVFLVRGVRKAVCSTGHYGGRVWNGRP